MSIKPSKYMVMVSNIRLFFIFIVTKLDCWPVFKQDPTIQQIFFFKYIQHGCIYMNIAHIYTCNTYIYTRICIIHLLI